MLIELACVGKDLDEDYIKQYCFAVADYGLSSICLSAGNVHKANSYISSLNKISAIIDYPNGDSTISIKLHSITESIRSGATNIDLVINQNSTYEELNKCLVATLKICQDKKVDLRAVIDYRLLKDTSSIMKLAENIKVTGINTLISSTQCFADDTNDNVSISYMISNKYKMNVICALSNPISIETYDKIKKYGLYGIRFHYLSNLKQVLNPKSV